MRWDVHFNFTVLRMISYNVDYYWSFNDLGYEVSLKFCLSVTLGREYKC